MAKAKGLRAVPETVPAWLRVARKYLTGLRRKDRAGYRAMRGRVFEAWPELVPAFERISTDYLGAVKTGMWRRLGTMDDAGTMCALVFESFAWWALDERFALEGHRQAERELLDLGETIARAAAELCKAVARTEELCLRHGLGVRGPRWVDDLDAVLEDLAARFPRWGNAGEVRSMIARDRRELYGDRPRVTDAIRSALSVGVLRSGVTHPMRHPFSGEWLRHADPEVVADDVLSAEALRVRGGSGAKTAAPQLRLLFASLRELAERNGAGEFAEGPLEWLTAAELSRLCNVMAGGGPETTGRRRLWGTPSELFDPETVRKARTDFVRKRAAERKT
jgi:hypothetical protein